MILELLMILVIFASVSVLYSGLALFADSHPFMFVAFLLMFILGLALLILI